MLTQVRYIRPPRTTQTEPSHPGNPLQIAVLNLFVSFKSRFSNLIVGTLTRDSVKRALMNGITAEQVGASYATSCFPSHKHIRY